MGKLKGLPSRLTKLPARIAQFDSGERGRYQAAPWRAWYNTQRWRTLRLAILLRDGYQCQWPGCGRIEPRSSQLVVDHKRAHRGEERLFWDEQNLETLCKPCHDGPKQLADRESQRRGL